MIDFHAVQCIALGLFFILLIAVTIGGQLHSLAAAERTAELEVGADALLD